MIITVISLAVICILLKIAIANINQKVVNLERTMKKIDGVAINADSATGLLYSHVRDLNSRLVKLEDCPKEQPQAKPQQKRQKRSKAKATEPKK